MVSVGTLWSSTDSLAVVEARMRRGHSQDQCAARLREIGCQGATKDQVSRWETGTVTPRRSTQVALRRYVEEAGAQGAPFGRESDVATFADAIRGLEPPLGPLQRRFIEAQLTRFERGDSQTKWDVAAMKEVARFLRLDE